MEAINIRLLIDQARRARGFSKARFSGFQVGAALQTKEGRIYLGCNVESSSYGLSICAERVALTKAISEGDEHFSAIAIIGPDNNYCPPCGACRQLLHDYAPQIEIIISDGKENKIMKLAELLPVPFEESKLRKK